MSNNFGFQIKPIPDETFFGLVVTTGILAGFETYSQAYLSRKSLRSFRKRALLRNDLITKGSTMRKIKAQQVK